MPWSAAGRSRVRRRALAAAGALGMTITVGACSAASITPPSAKPSTNSSRTPAPVAGAASSTPHAQDPAQAQLRQVATAIHQPYRLTAPTKFPTTCPDLSAQLSQAFRTPMAYWQGQLPTGPEGCQYATVASTAGGSLPQDRFWVNIGFLVGTTAEQMQRGEHSPSSMCLVVDVPLAATQAVLDRCNRGDIEVVYDLLVPDTSGAGIWVLSTDAGTRYSGVEPSKGLVAIAGAAQSIFGD